MALVIAILVLKHGQRYIRDSMVKQEEYWVPQEEERLEVRQC